MTTRLAGRAEAGRLEIAGAEPALRRRRCAVPVEVVLRCVRPARWRARRSRPALAGRVEERLFLGTHYRHYVRLGTTCSS